jgi:hypothetical protein
MRNDWYLRAVLTVIAAALVYLCVVFTPMPLAMAQGARTPGEMTGPAETVIVGFRLASDAGLPVRVAGPVTVTGDVKVSSDVRVTGRVQTEQAPGTSQRVVLAGWENNGFATNPGTFVAWDSAQKRALPVTTP